MSYSAYRKAMMSSRFLAAVFSILVLSQAALGQEIYIAAPQMVADEKAVFATVESANVVPARARIGGTVATLAVKEGDRVEQGQVLAGIGDEKIALQIRALDAQIAAAAAQLAQAQTDLSRAESLIERGVISKSRLDEARTAHKVAANLHRSRVAERSVLAEQLAQGNVLSPAAGRVLTVPVTAGTVVMAGEPVAIIAEENFVLRLRVPERHARFLKAGDPVRIDADELGEAGPRFGTIRLVYPQIEDGRVIADADVSGLGDYFVGQRIRVWVSGGQRQAFVIPQSLVTTRFGVDYVRLQAAGGTVIDVPVQRGRALPRPDQVDGIEILSGLKAGDRLVRP